ncbi:hypothetical protein [Candidatus Spongiihabitans sp.]|uniref:hypothetical protein n=1 Tax=Candidatus Spongiihabitans sp. TaxID=3101308 RepID=UPI003C7C7C4B
MFRAIQLNMSSGVAELLILNVLWHLNAPLSSRFTITYNSSLPGLFRAIQLNMSSGVAAPFDARIQ